MTWAESVEAFAAGAAWFVQLTEKAEGRWEEPGLGEWDVRALVGHLSRSLTTVEVYLARPATAVETDSAAAYYLTARELARGPEVADRGRAAGEALGVDPAAAVRELARRVVPLVRRSDPESLVTTIVGGMRLADYLPTRIFELTVHGVDLAAALGEPMAPPATCALSALHLLSELAAVDGTTGQLLLALTGRTQLPTGFSLM